MTGFQPGKKFQKKKWEDYLMLLLQNMFGGE